MKATIAGWLAPALSSPEDSQGRESGSPFAKQAEWSRSRWHTRRQEPCRRRPSGELVRGFPFQSRGGRTTRPSAIDHTPPPAGSRNLLSPLGSIFDSQPSKQAAIVPRTTYAGRFMERKCIRAKYSPITPKAKSCAPEKIETIEAKNGNPGTLPSRQ